METDAIFPAFDKARAMFATELSSKMSLLCSPVMIRGFSAFISDDAIVLAVLIIVPEVFSGPGADLSINEAIVNPSREISAGAARKIPSATSSSLVLHGEAINSGLLVA